MMRAGHAAEEAPVQQWEYMVVRVLPDGRWVGWEDGVWRERRPESEAPAVAATRTVSSEEVLLHALGTQGWELTGIVSSTEVLAHRLYFKRPRFTASVAPATARRA